jgi:putative CRISPR-associated protein (TIGR02619 family)
LIVSTCGTSIFTNALSSQDLRKLLTNHANTVHQNDLPPTVVEHIQHVENRLLANSNLQDLINGSAELAGLAAFYGGTLNANSGQDHHILLSTDTWLGERSAQIIASVLQQHGHSTEVKRCQDLRTDSLSAYRTALSSLVDWAYTDLPRYKSTGYRVIFNLTGGFKAVQGFMQTLGALHADESVYVFERSNELIRLPRLPIKMHAESWVRDNLIAFRRMAQGLKVEMSQVADVPEVLLFTVDNEATLSEWGELVWREIRPTIYSEILHPSPSPKVAWGSEFERSLRDIDPSRLSQINTKIDDLARFMETGQALKSLDFKVVKSGPVKGSTYEVDAWADGSAKRLFGHHSADKTQFLLDRLDHALH